MRLIETADGIIEAFRSGVAERLGIGPQDCLARNPRLVYGRMTGWGQEGPLAARAGHDLNYIALTAALAAIGRAGQKPTPPLNLVGDGSGAMLMAFGMVCGLLETQRSGQGQVIDAAMMDAAALVFSLFSVLATNGYVKLEHGSNAGDSGAPFYEVYETADGALICVAAMEPQFYVRLLAKMELDPATLPDQNDRAAWPAMKAIFAERFLTRTQAEWVAQLCDEDTCFAPVLNAAEAITHPHAVARHGYCEVAGVTQPVPAPRLSRSGTPEPAEPPEPGRDSTYVLAELGMGAHDIAALRAAGIVV